MYLKVLLLPSRSIQQQCEQCPYIFHCLIAVLLKTRFVVGPCNWFSKGMIIKYENCSNFFFRYICRIIITIEDVNLTFDKRALNLRLFWEELCKWILNEKYCSFAKKIIVHNTFLQKKAFAEKNPLIFRYFSFFWSDAKKWRKMKLKFNPFTLRWRNVTMHFPLINQYWGMDYEEEPKSARRDAIFLMFQSILSQSLKIVENSP